MRLFQTLIISLMLHAFFYTGLIFWVHKFPIDQSRLSSQPIEIAIHEENSDQLTDSHLNIVRQSEVPEDQLTQSKADAHFWSLQTQRVKTEMKAANSGLTQNRSDQHLSIPISRSQNQKTAAQINQNKFTQTSKEEKHDIIEKTDIAESGDIPVKKIVKSSTKKKLLPDFRPQPILPSTALNDKNSFKEKGISTLGEFLPNNIKIGSFTSLNTDQYLYYSFFSRIEELIRYRWENNVRSEITRISSHGYSGPRKKDEWTTQVTILLKPSGNYYAAIIDRKSGLNGFDFAAANAFRDAQFFPNPPQELVGKDGYIRLSYSFRVRWEPQINISAD